MVEKVSEALMNVKAQLLGLPGFILNTRRAMN